MRPDDRRRLGRAVLDGLIAAMIAETDERADAEGLKRGTREQRYEFAALLREVVSVEEAAALLLARLPPGREVPDEAIVAALNDARELLRERLGELDREETSR